MTTDNGTDRVTEAAVPTEAELLDMRRTAASLLAQTERWLVLYYGMPRERRLLLSRRERRSVESNHGGAGRE